MSTLRYVKSRKTKREFIPNKSNTGTSKQIVSPVNNITQLQRVIGNKAVQRQVKTEKDVPTGWQERLDQMENDLKQIDKNLDRLKQRIAESRKRLNKLASYIEKLKLKSLERRVKEFNPSQPDKKIEEISRETKAILEEFVKLLKLSVSKEADEKTSEHLETMQNKFVPSIKNAAREFRLQQTKERALHLAKLVEIHQLLGGDYIESETVIMAAEILGFSHAEPKK